MQKWQFSLILNHLYTFSPSYLWGKYLVFLIPACNESYVANTYTYDF